MDRNTFGLFLAFAALVGVLLARGAARLDSWLACGRRLEPALGTFVYSIIPISIAFHFSHYLTALMVNGQYALIAASDPFGTGLDLFGTGAHRT